MTANKFNELCNQYTVDPAIALENDSIVSALQAKNDAPVEILLVSEF